MRRHLNFIAIVSIIFIASTVARAQVITTQGGLNGKVLDQDGKPLQGATVRAQQKANNYIGEGKTNKNGEYTIVGLYTGTYKVILIVNGRIVMSRGETDSDAVIVSGDREEVANFDMRKVAASALANAPVAPEADPNKGKSKAEIEANKKKNEEMKSAFAAGVAAMKAKNFDEAIKQLQLAAEKDPTQPAVFGNLGVAYLNTKKYPEAIEALRKSIALAPGDAAVHAGLSTALAQTGKTDEAQQEAQEVAKLDPALAGSLYFNLGASLVNTGKTKEAVTFFKKAIDADPKNAEAHYQLGIAYFGSPDTVPLAITSFEKYLELQPAGPNAEAAKGLIAAAKASAPSGNKKD
jgi:tetratricopeptide (TPR) repeat protein